MKAATAILRSIQKEDEMALKKITKKTAKPKSLPFVVVRTYSAGVHCGVLAKRSGKEVELLGARRIWRWRGANTLNEVATRGVAEDWTRISDPVESITLTEAIEIIPCTYVATENLRRSRWAN